MGDPRPSISYRDYRFNLLAGVPSSLPVNGNYYQVITAIGLITLEFDGGVTVNRRQGTGGPASYTRVTVTSPVDQGIVISLGDTGGLAPYDGNANLAGVVVNVTTVVPNVITPADDTAIANGAAATLAAVDATRQGLWVTIPLVDSAGALIVSNNGVRVGDSTVSATRGAEMFPGDTRYFPGTMRVDAFNNTGVSLKPRVLAQRFV